MISGLYRNSIVNRSCYHSYCSFSAAQRHRVKTSACKWQIPDATALIYHQKQTEKKPYPFLQHREHSAAARTVAFGEGDQRAVWIQTKIHSFLRLIWVQADLWWWRGSVCVVSRSVWTPCCVLVRCGWWVHSQRLCHTLERRAAPRHPPKRDRRAVTRRFEGKNTLCSQASKICSGVWPNKYKVMSKSSMTKKLPYRLVHSQFARKPAKHN